MPLPDIDSLATLGGTLQNYAPVEDPTTDLDAAADNKSRCNIAMATHTLIRSWVRFKTAATTGAMVLVTHDSVWGSLPAVAPTLARATTGTFTLTLPASVNDEITPPNAHVVNIRASWGASRSTTAAHDVQCVPTSANVVTVYIRDSISGTLIDAAGTDIDVFVL